MFKAPSAVPQDLLLIQELISTQRSPLPREKHLHAPEKDAEDSSIGSSGEDSNSESEDEVNASLVVVKDLDESEHEKAPEQSAESSSDPDSSSEEDSDSDSDPTPNTISKHAAIGDISDDDDGEAGPSASGATLKTKNEIVDTSSSVPDFAEVGPDETLEKVGEVSGIVGNVVIVKGDASAIADRASERALDSDSLLVFEDRRVLGYVYETFGPTSQPFYQVKFPSTTSINPDIIQVSRIVFHVPGRSKFVFPSQLKALKGSDASNVYDEEIAEDEAEFSDDEKEAAFKAARRRSKQPGSRASSVLSSRATTPIPSHMRDQEMASESYYGASPYDEFGPYNPNEEAGPSRPLPLPYDDPYTEEPLNHDGLKTEGSESPASVPTNDGGRRPDHRHHRDSRPYPARGERPYPNSRGRGQGRGRERGRGRGRDRPSGRSFTDRHGANQNSRNNERSEPARPDNRRSLSPASLAIARATGQYPSGAPFHDSSQQLGPSQYPSNQSSWSQPQTHYNPYFQSPMVQTHSNEMPSAPLQISPVYPGVQPHINPRFAAAFGINMNLMQQHQFGNAYGTYGAGSQTASSAYTPTAWSVPTGNYEHNSTDQVEQTSKQDPDVSATNQ